MVTLNLTKEEADLLYSILESSVEEHLQEDVNAIRKKLGTARMYGKTPRCPVCSAPVESVETPDADNQARLNPCNHYVTVRT